MKHRQLIARLYKEIGLQIPEVEDYPSLDDLFASFEHWRSRAIPFIANDWSYQYPILHPHSYWAQNHLSETGFQFDIVRSPNQYGCYVHSERISEIAIDHKDLSEQYDREVSQIHDLLTPSVIDPLYQVIFDLEKRYPTVFDDLDLALEKEDPTNQADMKDFMFLGPFCWLRVERELLQGMRTFVGELVCNEHYSNVVELCESHSMYVTFRDVVFVCSLRS